MIDDTTIQNMILMAKRIADVESRHNFDVYAIDDSEHIPRMERIADAVCDLLSELGCAPERCAAARNELIEHARQTYVAVWMQPLPGDDTAPVETDGIQAFDKHLSRRKKRTSP